MANTRQNNPKSFVKNKFDLNNQQKADPDCALGVQTASNQHNERNYEFLRGYKNHVLVDCITGLPVCELTTANVADSTVALDILKKTNEYLDVEECTFIADKAYDVKAIYNTVHDAYYGDNVIPLNKRNTKNQERFFVVLPFVKRGWQCTGTANFPKMAEHNRNTAVITSVLPICTIVPAITNVSTRVPKLQPARNMSQSQTTTDFPSSRISLLLLA